MGICTSKCIRPSAGAADVRLSHRNEGRSTGRNDSMPANRSAGSLTAHPRRRLSIEQSRSGVHQRTMRPSSETAASVLPAPDFGGAVIHMEALAEPRSDDETVAEASTSAPSANVVGPGGITEEEWLNLERVGETEEARMKREIRLETEAARRRKRMQNREAILGILEQQKEVDAKLAELMEMQSKRELGSGDTSARDRQEEWGKRHAAKHQELAGRLAKLKKM